MAGAYKMRAVRGKYSQAGYTESARAPMYIAGVPAGSDQDRLRDLNRIGYQSDRPWRETPVPVFEAETAAAPAPVVRRRTKKQTVMDRLAYHARRERGDMIMCVILLCVILMMATAWGQKVIEGADIQRSITSFRASTSAFRMENEKLEQQLEMAKSGERIRNLAQNELLMLRPERAETQTIYIQAPEKTTETTLQQNEEPRMEMLDILLGLLNVFHIGE